MTNENSTLVHKGVTMTNLHYIADEQLGGVEREYAEVERKANVGDYVAVTAADKNAYLFGSYVNGDVGVVEKYSEEGDEVYGNYYFVNVTNRGKITVYDREITTLDPTGNVRIDGKVYRLVDRKAAVGEKVLITEKVYENFGEIYTVQGYDGDGDLEFVEDEKYYGECGTYVVLEPINQAPADTIEQSADLSLTESDVRNNPRQVIDLIANMAGRLSKLESKVARLGTANQQAYDVVSRNVETWAQEIETIRAKQSTSFGTFDFSQLGGKTLKIVTGVDMADGVTCTTVIGYDEEDGKYYVLDTKIDGRSLTAEERREL